MRPWIKLGAALGALAALAFITYSRVPQMPVGSHRTGLELIPRDAAGVMVIDLARTRATPLYASWEKLLRAQPVVQDPGYAEFVRQTGFDSARDLDRIVVGWPAGDRPAAYLIAQGRFDRAKISTFLLAQANSAGTLPAPRNYGGLTIFSLPAWRVRGNQGGGTSDVPSYLALLDDHTVVLAAGKIEPVLDCALGEADSMLASPEFQPYLPEVEDSAIAAVFMATKLSGRLSPPPEAPMAIHWPHLQQLTLFAQPAGESLQVSAEGLFDTVAAAEAARDDLRGLLLLARAALRSANPSTQSHNKVWQEFLDGILLDQAGLRITLKAQITSQLVESLASQAGATNQRRKLSLPPDH